MKKYHSHNASEAFLPFLVIIVFILPLKLIYDKCYTYVFIISIILSLLFLVYIIKRTTKNLFDIFFYDDKIEIKYMHIEKTETILYNDLLEYHFIRAKNSYDFIKYTNGEKTFPCLNYENSIDFIKWLKEKNPEIKIVIYPPSSNLEYEFQKEYGFKYRKFHKDTV